MNTPSPLVKKIVISAAIAFVVSFTYIGMTSRNIMQTPVENKPGHHTAAGFQNYPFVETAAPKGVLFYLRRFWHSLFLPEVQEGHALPASDAMNLLNASDGDSVTWLGHASFLIRISGKVILTDPFVSEYASPVSWAGPRRFVAPGIPLDKLPPVDIVVVSHNHYDHLDEATLRRLKDKHRIHIMAPLGLKAFFIKRGYRKVSELDWGDSLSIEDTVLTALPAVHDSMRSTRDRNRTLWASWAITGPSRRILFIGDTGYSRTVFKQIGENSGPFDCAIVPIGAYEPRTLMWMSHITPEEAVAIGKEVRAGTLIASHWGTINLSDEPPWEPPQRFIKAGLENNFAQNALWIMKIGETRALSQARQAGCSSRIPAVN